MFLGARGLPVLVLLGERERVPVAAMVVEVGTHVVDTHGPRLIAGRTYS